MSATRGGPANRFGAGAFCAGLAFIVAATVLNVAHDRMQDYKLETLPLYIGTLYATTGKTGVTLLLVSIGMGWLLLGVRSLERRPSETDPASPELATGTERLYVAAGQQPANAAPVGGRIVLETWKYVTPPGGSPGSP